MKNNLDPASNADKNINPTPSISKIVTIIACLLIQLCAGILYLWSAFSARVQLDYSWAASNTQMVGSIMIFGFVLGNLFGGITQDKTNPRISAIVGSLLFCSGVLLTSMLDSSTISYIYLTYSIMSGIGCGFIYASALGCLQRWFPNRRGFAAGIAVASFGISTVIFAPLIKLLLNHNSVSVTFRILGIAFLILASTACVFIRLPQSESKNKNLTGLTPLGAIKKIPFWCIFLTCFFVNATWNILMPDIKTLGMERGLSDTMATSALMIAGIFNVLGRFSMASISDKIGRERSIIAASALTFCCAILLIWAGSGFYLVAVALTAFGYGGPSATLPAMCADTCGPRYNGTNYGIALLGLGFSSIFFKWLSNLIESSSVVKDGNVPKFMLSFLMAALTALIPIGLMWLYRRFNKSKNSF